MPVSTLRRFFSHRVAWLALIVSCGIGALFAHTMHAMRQEHWDYYLRTNTNLSNTVAKGLEWSLDAVDLTLQKTAIALKEAQVFEVEGSSDKPAALLEALWQDLHNSQVMVLNAQGQRLMDTGSMSDAAPQWAQQDFFQAFRKHQRQEVFIGQPTKDLVDGQYVLPVARPVHGRAGVLLGVVVGSLRMQEINAWLSSMNLGEHSGVNVLREDGLVLTRFPYVDMQARHNLAGTHNMARFLSSPQGSFVGYGVIDGHERLYAFRRVGHFPLVVNVAQSTQTILRGWVRNAWYLGIFAGLLMLSCLGLAVLFVRELSRREATESDLFAEKERMRLTLQSIGDAVVCTDAQGRITYLNPVAQQITGLSTHTAQHQPLEVIHQGGQGAGDGNLGAALRHALATGLSMGRTRTTVTHQHSGERLDVDELVSPVLAADGSVVGAVAVMRDITLAAAHEARMQRLAFHDVLTQLPNRLLLQDRASQALARSKRTGELVAVVYLDLDRFKYLNDHYGHEAGDAALVHVAQALQACVRESDTVCRLGGDEFVLLLPGLSSTAHLAPIAEKIHRACAQPLVWQGTPHVLYASGGMALYPTHATDWAALLRCADSAMYAAKKAGRQHIRLHQIHGPAAWLAGVVPPPDVP